MQRDGLAQARALAENRADVTAIALAAERLNIETFKRQPREHHDAVISFLTVERDVLIAEPLEALAGKFVVGTFGLLQTQDIGSNGLYESGDAADAQPHGVDVPGGDRQAHAT